MSDRQFGRLPSPPDHRDYPCSAFLPTAAPALPAEYRLPCQLPSYDQDSTSMCVDFALRELKEMQEWIERGQLTPMANGYVYANRAPGDFLGEGMDERSALNCLVKDGIPPAASYNVTGTYEQCVAYYQTHKPEADAAAKEQRVLKYVRCTTTADVMGAIYHLKSPVLIGITVTSRFAAFTGRDGVILDEPAANFQEGKPDILGGHALIVVGWKLIGTRTYWVVQNSWGPGWGDGGMCYIPVGYPGIDELWAVTDRHPRGKRVRLTIGSTTLELATPQADGTEATEPMQMDVAPFIQGNRTFVPLRFVSDALAKLLGGPIMLLPQSDEQGNVVGVDVVIPDPDNSGPI